MRPRGADALMEKRVDGEASGWTAARGSQCARQEAASRRISIQPGTRPGRLREIDPGHRCAPMGETL